MPYISAVYAPPSDDPMMAAKPGGPNRVIATDDQGVEWHLTDDSQVGDWLRYQQAGGQIASARDVPTPQPAKKKGKK